MKAHDLAKILLGMENVEVAYQYYEGGSDMFEELSVENITLCNGTIYLTHKELCKHNGIEIDVKEIHCYCPISPHEPGYLSAFKDRIKERIQYLQNTDGCKVYADQFDDWAYADFDTLEDYNKFTKFFK